MGSVAYTVIPLAAVLIFWGYLFFRIYSSLKATALSKGLKIAVPIAAGGAIALPIAGLWTATDAYSIAVVYFCGFLLLSDLMTYIVRTVVRRDDKVRRIIHNFMLIPLLCTVIVSVYGIINVGKIVRTEYAVRTEKSIRAEGYKIALLSDVHYGKQNIKNDLESIADRLSAQELDVVVLCGDIVDEDTTKAQMREIFSILGSIESAYGSYFVLGNHDKQSMNKEPKFTEAELVAAIEQNGIVVLRDEAVSVGDEILLVGRRDVTDKRKSVEELLSGADGSKYVILAEHRPIDFKIKSSAGVDLQLSGHTHGGQLFPVGTLMELFGIGDMVYGKKQVGSMTAITTSGLPGSHPMRTQGKTEYVIITVGGA